MSDFDYDRPLRSMLKALPGQLSLCLAYAIRNPVETVLRTVLWVLTLLSVGLLMLGGFMGLLFFSFSPIFIFEVLQDNWEILAGNWPRPHPCFDKEYYLYYGGLLAAPAFAMTFIMPFQHGDKKRFYICAGLAFLYIGLAALALFLHLDLCRTINPTGEVH